MLIHLPQNSTLYIEQEDNTSKSTELVNTTQRRSMDLSDVEALEAAEAQLDQFIEKRARERGGQQSRGCLGSLRGPSPRPVAGERLPTVDALVSLVYEGYRLDVASAGDE